jgi:WD40 repeat protein
MSMFSQRLSSLTLEKRIYLLRTLPRHLVDADQIERIHSLLTDLEFVEAKCSMGMVNDLQGDYILALEILPEAQEELARVQTHGQQVERYIQETIAYARSWSDARDRHAIDPTSYPLPRSRDIPPPATIPSLRLLSNEEIQADADRISREPSRLDQIRAFSEFVSSNSHYLLEYGSIAGFCIQQGFNYSNSGPVADSADRILSSWAGGPLLLQSRDERPIYNPQPGLLRTLEGHTGFVNSVDITFDGTIVVSGSTDQTVRVWSLATGQCLRVMVGHTDNVQSVSITPDGRIGVSGSNDSTVRVWDLTTGQCLRVLTGHTGIVWGVSTTPDGRYALSGGNDRSLRLWNLATGKCEQIFEYKSFIFQTHLTQDGRIGVSGGYDGLWVWDLTTGKSLRVIEQGRGDKLKFMLTSDGATAITTGRSESPQRGLLEIWDLSTGQRVSTLHGHQAPVTTVSLAPDGKVAVSGGLDHNLCVWDLTTGQCLRVLTGHTDNIESVSITPDGRIGVSGSNDSTVRVWNLVAGQCPPTSDHAGSVGIISLTRSGTTAVLGSDWSSRGLQIWKLDTQRHLHTLEDSRSVNNVSVTPDGTKVVSGSEFENALRILDLTNGQCVHILSGHTGGIKSLSVSLDSKMAVSGSNDDTLRVWDLSTGRCLRVLQGHKGFIHSVSLTSDSTTAISGSYDHSVRVWDLRTGQCMHILDGHSSTVWRVALTPDGRIALSGSGDHTMRIWDLVTGRCLHILEHIQSVERICLTPDGRIAVTGDYDGILRVWDLATGQCLHRLRISDGGGRPEVSLTPDGKNIVSGGRDGTVRIWSLDTGECMAIFPAATDVQSLSEIRNNRPFAFAIKGGEVLAVNLYGHDYGMPLTTAVRLWVPDDEKGQWENHLTALCEHCGRRFQPADVVLDAIRSISAHLTPEQSPCLELPAEAWNESQLLSVCPHCHQHLKFNPFVVDALHQDPLISSYVRSEPIKPVEKTLDVFGEIKKPKKGTWTDDLLSNGRAESAKPRRKKWWRFWK